MTNLNRYIYLCPFTMCPSTDDRDLPGFIGIYRDLYGRLNFCTDCDRNGEVSHAENLCRERVQRVYVENFRR